MPGTKRLVVQKGEVFGNLVSLENGEKALTKILCRCICGIEKPVRVDSLRYGLTTSCGRCSALKHGYDGTVVRNVWRNMVSRCTNTKDPAWQYYGGRGISVCDEWLDFTTFRLWYEVQDGAGVLQLDRRNNDLGYNPENCRLVTKSVNMRNRRNAFLITAFGETKSAVEWAEDARCKVSAANLRQRVKVYGWDGEQAVATPVNRHRK